MEKRAKKRLAYIITALPVLIFAGIWAFKNFNFNPAYTAGEQIDSLHGVIVYYNGGINSVSGRNIAADGYNLGLKYQCVEFVKRYYFEHFQHKMPDSYGHAKDFFDKTLKDGQKNEKRDLTQYTNPAKTKPQTGDLLIFDATIFNRYGHVAIISKVTAGKIEFIQQNPGPFGKSRESIDLHNVNGKWHIENRRILGWLRKE